MNINDFILAGKLLGSGGGGGGGGSSLPSVTSADKGKVLAVNASGEWAAENKIAIIHESEEGVLDKTWKEIFDLLSAGVITFINYVDAAAGAGMLYILTAYEGDGILVVTASGIYADFPVLNFVANTVNDYPALE